MISLYKGSRGKGKTLTMVKDALIKHSQGYRVISNIQLGFGEYIDSREVLRLNRDSQLYNCVLALDEIQMFFDSRNFNKTENKDFSNFLQQIRKRNISILFTTQYINMVDLRLRQQIDQVIYPNHDINTGMVIAYIYDLTSLEDDFGGFPRESFVIFDAKPLYNVYNTFEMLK